MQPSCRSAEEIKKNPLAQEFTSRARLSRHGTLHGKHAAGVVITSKPLVEYLPMTLQEEP
jgi:DNA polymerase-3 subunit alpha